MLNANFRLPEGTWSADFSRNNLTELKNSENSSDKIWSNGSSLRAVDFSRNSIKNVDQNFFEQMPVLEIIDLSRNELSDLSENLFDSLASLQTLVLSGNRLKYVRKEWFKDLSNLYRLDLSYNPLGETKIDRKIC